MLNRREFLGITAGAGATLGLTPQLLRAFQQRSGNLIQRAIPSTGEMLPVIGLGFANHPSCTDPALLREVLKTFSDNGGRVFDTQHSNASNSEPFHAMVANELGIQNKLFFGLQGSRPGVLMQEPNVAVVKAQIDSLFATFKVPKLDLVMLGYNSDPANWGALKEAKKAGRIRYIGASAVAGAPGIQPRLEALMREEPIDFVSVNYAVDRRYAEDKILPLALERKIAVLTFFPFGGANGASCTGGKGLFARVANTPLPEWAAAFDAKTWAQFFLKYVVSHPAVTAVRVGTTKAHHMLDNIGGGIGRLPDEAMRKRMSQFVDALPGAPPVPPTIVAVPVAILDRYAGEYKTAAGATLTFRRVGERLRMKLSTNAEEIFIFSTAENRFFFGAAVIEFHRDSAGTVTGLTYEQATGTPAPFILEQGNQKVSASRIH